MTLPVNPPISLTDVLAELRVVSPNRGAAISLGDSDVRALAGKPNGAVSLSDLFGKSSYIPMTVTATGDSGANYNSQLNGGTVSCYPSVMVQGGRGARTYNWRLVNNPNGVTLSNATSPSCTVSITFTKNSMGSATADLVCDVKDETGATVTSNTVQAYLEWSNNA